MCGNFNATIRTVEIIRDFMITVTHCQSLKNNKITELSGMDVTHQNGQSCRIKSHEVQINNSTLTVTSGIYITDEINLIVEIFP